MNIGRIYISELKMRMQLFITYVIMIAASSSLSYAEDINSHHLEASFKFKPINKAAVIAVPDLEAPGKSAKT